MSVHSELSQCQLTFVRDVLVKRLDRLNASLRKGQAERCIGKDVIFNRLFLLIIDCLEYVFQPPVNCGYFFRLARGWALS